MLIRIVFITILASLIGCQCIAQTRIGVQGGISYIEHFSTGVTLNFGKKHSASMLCGSNFFIKMSDFRNLFLQYDYSFVKWKVAGFTPYLGARGGDSWFTDDYYRWHVVHAIPVIGFRKSVNEKLDLFFDAGIAFSFEQSVERIQQGEIGHYREKLPEVKAGIVYNLHRKK